MAIDDLGVADRVASVLARDAPQPCAAPHSVRGLHRKVEAIGSVDGEQQSRVPRIWLDLSAQAVNVCLQHMGRCRRILTPHAFQEYLTIHRTPSDRQRTLRIATSLAVNQIRRFLIGLLNSFLAGWKVYGPIEKTASSRLSNIRN